MKHFRNYRRREKEKNLLGEDVLYEEKTLLRHNRISVLKVFIIILACMLAMLLLFVFARLLFRVESITVDGNDKYSADEILAVCGIEQGDLMFSFPSSKVKRQITESLPYVEKVELKREYPSTVHITLTEYDDRFMICQRDKYILISHDMKVLEVASENEWGEDVILVEIPPVSRAIEGMKLEFADIENTEYITDFILALDLLDIEQKIDRVELTDIFAVRMVCEDRYVISFGKYGKYESVSIQMRSLSKVMSSDLVKTAAAALIDVSDPKQTSVIPYDSAEDMKKACNL